MKASSQSHSSTAQDIPGTEQSGSRAARRGMWGPGERPGSRHLFEIVYNSVDEAVAAMGRRPPVTLINDDYMKVEDDKVGTSVDTHPVTEDPLGTT